MIRFHLGLFLVALLWAPAAMAQGYFSMTFGQQFQFGAMSTLNGPIILLAMIAVGLFSGLCPAKPKLWIWVGLLGGMLAGMFVAEWVPQEVVLAALAFAILTAVLATIARPFPRIIQIGVPSFSGALSMLIMLFGNPLDGLPFGIYLGIFTAMVAVMSIVAVATMGLLRLLPYPATRIGLRIASSWVAAVAIMYLAFVVSRFQ